MKKDKTKQNDNLVMTEIDKKMQKYYKACENEKKGKSTVISLIGSSVLLFIILLIVILKMSGVGKTIVFDTSVTGSNSQVDPYVTDTADIEASNIFDVIDDAVADGEES